MSAKSNALTFILRPQHGSWSDLTKRLLEKRNRLSGSSSFKTTESERPLIFEGTFRLESRVILEGLLWGMCPYSLGQSSWIICLHPGRMSPRPQRRMGEHRNLSSFKTCPSPRIVEVAGIRHSTQKAGVAVAMFCHMGQRGGKKRILRKKEQRMKEEHREQQK